VRGDLIRILGNLMKRKDKFDYILIETTGLADPGPVAQTFFVDDEMQGKLRLDGIVTVVDAKHIWEHLDESDEAKEQIAFADVILLNKTDLAPADAVDRLETRLRSMNAAARIIRTQNSLTAMDNILNVGGFNLDRALQVDPRFLEPEYPFEWAGVYRLDAGNYSLVLHEGPDPAMKVVALPLPDATQSKLEAAQLDAVVAFSDQAHAVKAGGTLSPGKRLWQLELGGGVTTFNVRIETAGAYALFTEHHPDEFKAELRGVNRVSPAVAHVYKPDHEHDEAITSVGINIPGDLSEKKLNTWLRDLLMNQGPDIFRMKGILSIKGSPERFVFQGVHMLFDGRPDRPWGKEPRHNSLIFIGRNLDRTKLTEGFRACLA
jgi:G3E family GTPase